MNEHRDAKFGIGQKVRHRHFPFRGIIFDVDPVFANTDEWWHSIPEDIRPHKNQPFYHLLAETDSSQYDIIYVSEQNLLVDESEDPVNHPSLDDVLQVDEGGAYRRTAMVH